MQTTGRHKQYIDFYPPIRAIEDPGPEININTESSIGDADIEDICLHADLVSSDGCIIQAELEVTAFIDSLPVKQHFALIGKLVGESLETSESQQAQTKHNVEITPHSLVLHLETHFRKAKPNLHEQKGLSQ